MPRDLTKARKKLETLKKLLGTGSGPRINGQLHLADFLVNFLHKMNDKVDQFVLVHLFCVEVRDEEADVVALDRFPAQNHKIFGPHHHETRKLVAQNLLNFVGLLHGDADPDRVYARLDEDAFLFVAADHHRGQQELLRTLYLHFGLVVPKKRVKHKQKRMTN